MIIAFDSSFLSLMLNPGTRPCPNPSTGKPVDYCAERIEALIDTHSKNGNDIIIPTPCLAELLCAVPDLKKAIDEINKSAVFTVASIRCALCY